MTELENLYKKTSEYLDREVGIERTIDGKYVVNYLSFSSPPPPRGRTIQEALEKFIAWWEELRPNESRPPLDKELEDVITKSDTDTRLPED